MLLMSSEPQAAGDSAAVPARLPGGAGPVVSVIIISYNTRQMTLDCLHALYADLGELQAEVFVVDNASSDGSAAAIAEIFPQVRVIANPVNVGFGAANNQA